MLRTFIVGIALLGMPLSAAYAQTADELRNQINGHNAQIEQLNKEIAAFEKQLTEVGAKKQTLQNTLTTLDISRKKLTSQINVTKNKISAIQLEIQTLSGSIVDKETSIKKDGEGLAQALSRVYEAGEQSMAEQILGTESMSALWNDFEANSAFQDAVMDHIHSLSEAKEELTISRDASEKKHQELERERRNLISEQTSLDINRKEQQSLLAQTKSQESNYQAILREKQAAKEAFEKTLNDLESKLQYTLDPSRIPAAGKGILRWPLDNVKVTQYFGNTEFARSGAYSGKGHNGIDLRASIGTPIKAALTGTVKGTGDSGLVRGCYSYGRWVLIQHGNGLTTLYAHLSQINVSEGQSVATGEVIGYSGNTGYATGPHLHFGVYASNGVRVMRLGESTGKQSPCANAIIPVSPLGAYLNPMEYL